MHLQAYAVEGTNEVIQIHISHTARLKDQIIICTRHSDKATVYTAYTYNTIYLPISESACPCLSENKSCKVRR